MIAGTSTGTVIELPLPPEPPFLVVAAGFLLEYHEREPSSRCTRCRDNGSCPRVEHARRVVKLYGDAVRIVRTGL